MTETPKASPPVWRRQEIESPCVQICVVHPETRLCIGCSRSIEEIGSWSQMDPARRREIMDELPDRQATPRTRRGGRAARVK